MAYISVMTKPAAFGRLCVETAEAVFPDLEDLNQPPSGGCVLKPLLNKAGGAGYHQPPSGGCVLKLAVKKLP